MLSCLLLHHLLSAEDLDYLGIERVVHLAKSLTASHSRTDETEIARTTSKADQASVEQDIRTACVPIDTKVRLFLEAVEELIISGQLGVNVPGGQVYVMSNKAAVVVPFTVSMARDHLQPRNIVLPSNVHLYNMLRNSRLVEPDEDGQCVRKIRIARKKGTVSLSVLIFAADKVIPKDLLPNLPPIEFEIVSDPQNSNQQAAEITVGEQA